ncbi:MAG: flagellar filament capping protein FliD, partial [Chloroflexota bacterium]|nr:flagellar filament capping protein FliD [Chloroflexota bacterium]
LKDAGFSLAVDTSRYTDASGIQRDRFFTINGQQITVSETDTLNSVLTRMQSALPGWTVELTSDAAGRANNALRIVAPNGSTQIQLGAGSDTSNFLRVVNLLAAETTRQGSVGAITMSNQSADPATLSGTFSGASSINYVVRVAEVDSFGDTASIKAATRVQVSADGGATFGAAVPVIDGGVVLGNGLTLNFGAAGTSTSAGDTYSFTASPGSAAVVSAQPLGGTNTSAAIGGAGYGARFTSGAVGSAGAFKVNGVDIAYTLDDSINSIISRINGSTAGVRASYDRLTDRLQLTSIATGGRVIAVDKVAASKVTRSNATADDLTVQGFTGAANVNYVFKVNAVSGESATTVGATSVLVSRDGGATFDPTPVAVDPTTGEVNLAADGLTVKFGTGGTTTTVGDTYGFTAYTSNNHFLDRVGLAAGILVQTLGQNALYSIDDGPTQSSDTNAVANAVPGVSLNLVRAQASTDNPVTVSIAQDANAPRQALQQFVSAFNEVLSTIEKYTNYDKDKKTGSALTGDPSVQGLERQLRTLISTPALGIGGDSKYRTLADIGVSTGKVGSAIGTTSKLQIDDARLSAALADNPQAVETLLTGLTATAGAPSRVGAAPADAIAAGGVSGRPTAAYESGAYRLKIVAAAIGAAELWFDTGGAARKIKDATVVAGASDTSLVPGLTIALPNTLTDGAESKFTVNVAQRGTMVWMKQQLDRALGTAGVFQARTDGSDRTMRQIDDRRRAMEGRLADKEQSLYRKFSALESAMARAQSQSSGVIASLQSMVSRNQQ